MPRTSPPLFAKFITSFMILDFAPIDENSSDNFDIGNYSFLDEPEQSSPQQNSGADQGSEKRQAFDNDYERMMSERGELMSKPSFA